MTFEFYRLRFRFVAKGPLFFAAGKPGNILRGAFGTVFRKIACVPECRDARTCEIRGDCEYARVFEPVAEGSGPSGLKDSPRPFVFRAAHLDGRVVQAGEAFHFDVHLFCLREPLVGYFVLTFAQLAKEGLGPWRGRAELERVESLRLDGDVADLVYEHRDGTVHAPSGVSVALAGVAAASRITVRFLTPTELKSGQELAQRPEFEILFARVRDRVSTLRALYGAGPLELDFRGLGERAREVRLVRWERRHVDVERRSSRTGQVHGIGGFVGEAEYEGKLGEFMPLLDCARWVGVGRQTVWGKGEVEVSAIWTAPEK